MELTKVRKKWDFQRKKLLEDRGILQPEDNAQDNKRYKFDKAEDSLRRRIRLKRDLQAMNKEYLSVAKYQEKLKSMQAFSLDINTLMTMSPNQGPAGRLRFASEAMELDIKQNRSHSTSITLEFDLNATTKLSCFASSTTQTPNKGDALDDEELEFRQISKEEVLADLKGRILELPSPPKKKTKKLNWKYPCEKITLKGAVYGRLEISENKYIAFSPSSEERSEAEPYCFGALVTQNFTLCTNNDLEKYIPQGLQEEEAMEDHQHKRSTCKELQPHINRCRNLHKVRWKDLLLQSI